MARKTQKNEFPGFVTPMAAQLVAELPDGPEWLFEVKWDGYRALLMKEGEGIRIISRNANDLTRTYPAIKAAGLRVEADRAVIDGEIVALDESGIPRFQALQHRNAQKGYAIVFYAFDLLHLAGKDLMALPLEKRRAMLPKVIGQSGICVSVELPGSAADVLAAVKAQGLEGVIAKRRNSTYQEGERSSDWVKVKLDKQQEFVIGGYRPGGGTFDALLVGYYEGSELHFSGKVRNGLVPHVRRELLANLKPLHIDHSPFVNLPDEKKSRWGAGVTAEDMREMQWVKPKIVVQIRFVQFTDDGRLRHAAFLGLRTDKLASEVVREG